MSDDAARQSENQIIAERRAKLRLMRERGPAYPNDFRRDAFAGGLHEPSTATVVRDDDGETIITDGPFAETKEQLGGFWIIEVADLDAALAWAAKGSAACMGPVEVRPFQGEPES